MVYVILSTYAIRKEEHRLWKEKILSSSPPLRDAYILLGMKNHLYYMNNGSDLINLVWCFLRVRDK